MDTGWLDTGSLGTGRLGPGRLDGGCLSFAGWLDCGAEATALEHPERAAEHGQNNQHNQWTTPGLGWRLEHLDLLGFCQEVVERVGIGDCIAGEIRTLVRTRLGSQLGFANIGRLPPIFRRRAAGAAQQFLPGFGNCLGNRFEGSFDSRVRPDRRHSIWLDGPALDELSLDGWVLKPWLLRHGSPGVRLLGERRFAG